MRTTRIVIILLGIFAHLPLNAQYSLKCDPVIYPICPGSDDGNASGNLLNNAFKSALICDTAYVIQDAVFGTVEYVGSGGNVGEDSLYNYTTNTNCEPIDSFLAVECCADSTGSIVCDTVQHMVAFPITVLPLLLKKKICLKMIQFSFKKIIPNLYLQKFSSLVLLCFRTVEH